ncbi:hypothetical protein F5148DRAFT_1147386 [Russula earlei]|uniref:Uncharacterized protein n=1 Tax=Russula earlei TaxID=71964 RepID=A0ACC0UGE6_9AGAM|nr:hypothetical protein F5148DRAFT_1147386 [Russula earlei]
MHANDVSCVLAGFLAPLLSSHLIYSIIGSISLTNSLAYFWTHFTKRGARIRGGGHGHRDGHAEKASGNLREPARWAQRYLGTGTVGEGAVGRTGRDEKEERSQPGH